MKIGIITFHWATNYGAVLQCYALQETLKAKGNDVENIDYYPARYKKNYFRAFLTRHFGVIPQNCKDVKKDKNIESFRSRNLERSKYYKSNKQLKKAKSTASDPPVVMMISSAVRLISYFL